MPNSGKKPLAPQTPTLKFTLPRIIAAVFAFVCALVAISVQYWLSCELKKPAPAFEQKQEEWMTVFVHGSFATTLGFISMFNVIKDKVSKTNYKKMIKLMRKDPFFYQMQPLQELGLRPVTPTLILENKDEKYATLPVAAAYQTMSDTIKVNPDKNYFYTYGWSGLISQYRRRKEAIGLYQALITEYEALRKKGVNPKIRLIAHSHGGNLILNTAGIHDILQKGIQNTPTSQRYPDPDNLASMQALHTLLLEKEKKHPESIFSIAPFHIDEIIILGTPIQPETLSFFLSPFFKKIYAIYSDDDIIQGMDWVSTRRYYSDKRISLSPLTAEQPTIIQIRITLNKPKKSLLDALSTPPPTNTPPEQTMGPSIKGTIATIWSLLFGSRQQNQAMDPLHKEFWFMGWKNQNNQEVAQQYIKPYPYLILIPQLQKLISSIPDTHDFDIRLKFTPDAVHLVAYRHDTKEKRKQILINRELLKDLQTQAQAWQPSNVTPSYEMELLHKYSQMLNV